MDASAAIWAEESVDGVLERLSKAIAFVVGATATAISKVDGAAARRHGDALAARRRARRRRHLPDRRLPGHQGGARDAVIAVDLVPRRRSRRRRGVRAARAADERGDARAARRPRPLVGARGDLRHAAAAVHDEDEAVAWFLVGQAARRIEALGERGQPRRRILRLRAPPGP